MTAEANKKSQSGVVTAIRLDERLRHLTEIAASAMDMNLTDYVSWALAESFKSVSLHVPTEPEIIYEDFSKPPTVIEPDATNEASLKESKMIARLADDLWSENKFVRLWSQSILAPQTMNEEKTAFFEYLQGREHLWKSAKPLPGMKSAAKTFQPDKEKIHNEWEALWTAFRKQHQKGRKR